MKFKILALATASLVAVSVPSAAQVSHPKFGNWGYDATAMDASVKPGDDFFAYVNGAWDKRTEIAPDRVAAGVDVTLTDEAEQQVRDIVERLARDPAKAGPGGQRVGDLY